MLLFTSLVIFPLAIVGVWGHGRLMDPPARNAMWRYGYHNPVNYNDNELFCGGFIVHYQKNGGKCGVCGDNFKDKVPRKHEAGGVFGNGIIVRRYVMGQKITIVADLTTNHKGWMEVKICPNNDPDKIITQECLDAHPLNIVGLDHHRFVIKNDTKKVEMFTWEVQLPDFLTCSQCIIQWKYFAGNTWGKCNNGKVGVGCGDQETFINCADVEILSNIGVGAPADVGNPWALYYRVPGKPKQADDIQIGPLYALRPLVIRYQLCIPIGRHANADGMGNWCLNNCMKYPPNCPSNVCKCVHDCVAIKEFALTRDADVFCQQNCIKYPSHCPPEKCSCN